MEEKFNEATPNRPEGDRTMDAPLVLIDLPDFMKQIKEEDAWHKSDKNAITVFKTEKMRIVLIALHTNAELKPHKADGIISVQVLEGTINFSTDQQSYDLKKGQMVTLHENIMYQVKALEESMFLLTMNK